MGTRCFVIREDNPRVNVHGITLFVLCSSLSALISVLYVRKFDHLHARLIISAPAQRYRFPPENIDSIRRDAMRLVVGGLILLLLDQPILNDGGGGAGGNGLLTLDLDGHALVLLQATGEVGLFGGLRGLGGGESLYLANGVGLLDGCGLVSLQLLEIQLLDEVGCRITVSLAGMTS